MALFARACCFVAVGSWLPIVLLVVLGVPLTWKPLAFPAFVTGFAISGVATAWWQRHRR